MARPPNLAATTTTNTNTIKEVFSRNGAMIAVQNVANATRAMLTIKVFIDGEFRQKGPISM
jgi:hypothetical protein